MPNEYARDQDQEPRPRSGSRISIESRRSEKWISFGKVGDWGYVAKLTRNALLLRKTESFLFYPLSICAMWFYRKSCINRKHPRETCSKSLLTQSPWPCGQPPSSIWKSQMPGGEEGRPTAGGDQRATRLKWRLSPCTPYSKLIPCCKNNSHSSNAERISDWLGLLIFPQHQPNIYFQHPMGELENAWWKKNVQSAEKWVAGYNYNFSTLSD